MGRAGRGERLNARVHGVRRALAVFVVARAAGPGRGRGGVVLGFWRTGEVSKVTQGSGPGGASSRESAETETRSVQRERMRMYRGQSGVVPFSLLPP